MSGRFEDLPREQKHTVETWVGNLEPRDTIIDHDAPWGDSEVEKSQIVRVPGPRADEIAAMAALAAEADASTGAA